MYEINETTYKQLPDQIYDQTNGQTRRLTYSRTPLSQRYGNTCSRKRRKAVIVIDGRSHRFMWKFTNKRMDRSVNRLKIGLLTTFGIDGLGWTLVYKCVIDQLPVRETVRKIFGGSTIPYVQNDAEVHR